MEWLKNFFKRLFNRTKLIEEPNRNTYKQDEDRNNFIHLIKRTADLECDDGNGYKIIKITDLKDMV